MDLINELLNNCRHCNSCCHICPVQQLGKTSFVGCREKEVFTADVWNCTNCWLCQEVCPEDLNLWQAKILMQRQQPPPVGIARAAISLKDCGLSLPITSEINERRQEYHLSQIKTVNPQILYLLTH